MPQGQDPASTPSGLEHAGLPELANRAKLGPDSRHLQVTLRADHVLTAIADLARLVTDDSQAALRLTEDLLAGAERDTGLPSVTSGIIYGLDPRPCPTSLWLDDWSLSFGRVGQQVILDLWGSWQSVVHLSPVERHQVMETLGRAESMVRGIKAASQRALNQHVSSRYGFLACVPPHDTSPCGVLGLASPIVPGAPSRRPTPHQEVMATAA